MKNLLFLTFSLLTSTLSFSQDVEVKKINKGEDSSIKVELITEVDTLYSGSPYPIYLKVTNNSRKSIYIPQKLDLRSRLFPNGNAEIWDGAGVFLHIDPVPTWSSIHQENLYRIEPIPFILIKPKASVKLWLTDLNSHMQIFNENIDSEDLKIKPGRAYKLTVTYSNTRKKKGKEQKTFMGEAKSEEKTLYIK